MSNAQIDRPDLDGDRSRQFYRDMLTIRRFEEKAGQLFGMGLIGGFCHLCIGQEAIAVGVRHALREVDSVIAGHRNHGHMLMSGADPNHVMAELTGRQGGVCKGKGGSMHLFAPDHRFYGGHGLLGAQAPLATGIAFAHKYRHDGGICVVFLGDVALDQGQVYESLNSAALLQLPVVFVIENNSLDASSPEPDRRLCDRGRAFGIEAARVDGMDVQTVYQEACAATAHARARGPFILEATTYRYRGHSLSDPAKYGSQDERLKSRALLDPIERLRDHLLAQSILDEAGLRDIDKQVRDAVNAAARFAQDSPEPDEQSLMQDRLAMAD